MKKSIIVFTMAVLVWGCAKKMAPTASAAPNASNSGTVIMGNAPSTSSSTSTNTAATPTTPAILPEENTGAKTPATPATSSSAEVMGQGTFNAKCGKCHGLKATSDFTADRWVNILQVMAIKANLTEGEKENVLAYVKANAKK